MSKNKLIILVIVLVLVLANFGVALASDPSPIIPPQPNTLSLDVDFSPLPIYPPLMIFTATLNRVPPSIGPVPVVDYYLVLPDICSAPPMSTTKGCYPNLAYLGSAQVDRNGQAFFSKQMSRGGYTALARVTISGVTVWSNEVSFKVP